MATSNTGIFKRASNAADTWNESRGKENAALASWEGAIDEHAGAGTNPNTSTGGAVNITKNGQKVDISQITSVYGEKVDYHPSTDTEKDSKGNPIAYRIFYYDAAGYFGPAGTLYLKRDWTANDKWTFIGNINNIYRSKTYSRWRQKCTRHNEENE